MTMEKEQIEIILKMSFLFKMVNFHCHVISYWKVTNFTGFRALVMNEYGDLSLLETSTYEYASWFVHLQVPKTQQKVCLLSCLYKVYCGC